MFYIYSVYNKMNVCLQVDERHGDTGIRFYQDHGQNVLVTSKSLEKREPQKNRS